MSAATTVSFFPATDRDLFARALDETLAAQGHRIVDRGVHSGGPARRDDAADPNVRVLSWSSITLSGTAHSAVVTSEACEPGGRWDPELSRALSQASGGFGGVLEINRSADQYGVGLFYAGHTVELATCDRDGRVSQIGTTEAAARALCNDTAAYRRYEEYFSGLTGNSAALLLQAREAEYAYVVIQRSVTAKTPPASGGAPPLCRIMLANVGEPEFLRLAQEMGWEQAGGWRWTSGRAPFAGLPYILLQRNGPFDEPTLWALAKHPYSAFGMCLGEGGRPFEWVSIRPDRGAERGQSVGGQALLDRCRDYFVTIGETPDVLGWPATVAGHPLAGTRRQLSE